MMRSTDLSRWSETRVAVAAMRQEFGARWMGTQAVYTLVLAWVAAVGTYQIGRWLFF